MLRRVLWRGCAISATVVGRLPVGSLSAAWRRVRMDPIECRGKEEGGGAMDTRGVRWRAAMKVGDKELTASVSCRVWCLFPLLLLALLDVATVGEDFVFVSFSRRFGILFCTGILLFYCRTVAPSFLSIGSSCRWVLHAMELCACCPVFNCCLFFLRARVPHAHDNNPHVSVFPSFPSCCC
ncbi:mucin-associated surface protein (MASP) [Trypanosoma cruzi]|nr:mucin-associated surface protein (MASP) [Trypanosoma cruzi]